MLGLTACSSEDLTSPAGSENAGETMHVTLTVNRPSDKTRTALEEANGGLTLSSTWVSGDKLIVVNSANQKLGDLTLESGAETSEGVFGGEIAVSADEQYTVWYLGGSNANDATKKSYAYWDDDNNNVVNPLVGASEYEISGDIADLCRADLMKQVGIKFTIAGGKAYSADDVTLEPQNAMAHFKVTGYPTSKDGATMIATFGGQSYKVTNLVENVYLPLVPETYAPVFTLTTSDNRTYNYTFANETGVEAGNYYKAEDETTHEVTGIPVNLEEQAAPEPEDDDLVGPVIPIGNKKYRFVKGNLYCDILDKDNYVWHLYERETDYQLKAGTSSYNVNTNGSVTYIRQINGTSKGSYNQSNVNENNRYIDLFPWGATGLGTGNYKAKLPDIIRKGVAKENSSTTYTGAYWPSDVTNTMDPNGNANIIDLWKGYSFDSKWIYDFGYAYMQNGRPAGDNRTYVTAPLEAYRYICENSFSQGCVVKGANYDGVSDAKGALILYGITDIEDAKAAIKAVGGTLKSDFAALDPNNPESGFTYLIELPNYESLQALNEVKEVNGKKVSIQAMFFASGGNGVYMFSSNNNTESYVNTNATDGAYWTCNGSTGSSTNANAYGFYFRNTSSATEFCWKTDASGVSSRRNTQRSVRLMVEVTDSDSGTTGPEFSN